MLDKKKICIGILTLILLPSLVFGATIFSDDFNSYNDGNLDGQGGWNLYDGPIGSGQIQGTITYEGAKAVWFNNKYGLYKKIGNPIANGLIEIWIKAENITSGRIGYFFLNSETEEQVVWCSINENTTGAIVCYDRTISNKVLVGTITAGTWTNLKIEWRTSDDKFRAKVDDGSWGSWLLGSSGFNSIQSLVFGSGTTLSDFWFDTISETYTPPPPPPTFNYVSVPIDYVASLKTTAKEVSADLIIPILLIISLPLAFWFIERAVSVVQSNLTDKKE